MSGQMKQN